VTAYSSTLLN
jgi:hypothetical protein